MKIMLFVVALLVARARAADDYATLRSILDAALNGGVGSITSPAVCPTASSENLVFNDGSTNSDITVGVVRW